MNTLNRFSPPDILLRDKWRKGFEQARLNHIAWCVFGANLSYCICFSVGSCALCGSCTLIVEATPIRLFLLTHMLLLFICQDVSCIFCNLISHMLKQLSCPDFTQMLLAAHSQGPSPPKRHLISSMRGSALLQDGGL